MVRLAFLLQDQLTFLWSGSLQTLLHPTLFTRYQQRDAVLRCGHYYISDRLFDPDTDFTKARLYPVSRDGDDLNTDSQEEVDLLDVGLPPRFLFKIFPEAKDQDTLGKILTNVRISLCSPSGIVTAADTTVSATIAANLVNGLFAALFKAANIDSRRQQLSLVSLLKKSDSQAIRQFVQQANIDRESFDEREEPITVSKEILICAMSNSSRSNSMTYHLLLTISSILHSRLVMNDSSDDLLCPFSSQSYGRLQSQVLCRT